MYEFFFHFTCLKLYTEIKCLVWQNNPILHSDLTFSITDEFLPQNDTKLCNLHGNKEKVTLLVSPVRMSCISFPPQPSSPQHDR